MSSLNTSLGLQTAQLQATSQNQTQAVKGLKNAAVDTISKKAKDFESMVIAQLLGPMFDTLPTDGAFGGGSAEGTMRSFYVDAVAKSISQRGGFGISDAVQRQMLQLQGI